MVLRRAIDPIYFMKCVNPYKSSVVLPSITCKQKLLCSCFDYLADSILQEPKLLTDSGNMSNILLIDYNKCNSGCGWKILHLCYMLQAPEGENQPSTDVDLFVSTEKIMVLNTDLQVKH